MVTGKKIRIPAHLNRKLGKALHEYAMLAEGDSVLVAVSGGVDSLVLAVVLKLWQAKAPIHFELDFIHIDHQFAEGNRVSLQQKVVSQLRPFGITLRVETELALTQERSCFLCARNRRKQLFDMAEQEGYNKVALGHHRDDLIETFLLNTFYSGNISTMCPVQQLFNGRLMLLRPMAYLEKKEIVQLAALWQLEAVDNFCPFADTTRREKVHRFLEYIHRQEPGVKDSIFAALFNVRSDYLP